MKINVDTIYTTIIFFYVTEEISTVINIFGAYIITMSYNNNNYYEWWGLINACKGMWVYMFSEEQLYIHNNNM